MRKLTLLIVGLIITLFGLQQIADAEFLTAYLLRDGLLIALVGMVIFALNSSSFAVPAATHIRYRHSVAGRVLMATGAACGLAGGLLFLVPQSSASLDASRLTLWLLGLGLFPLGAWWRGAKVYAPPAYRWKKEPDGDFVRVPADGDVEEGAAARGLPREPASAWRMARISPEIWGGVLLVTLLGALVRVWHLLGAPPDCVAQECARGLLLLEPGALSLTDGRFNPLFLLARFLSRFHEDAVGSLRWAAAAIGVVSLPVLFLTARRLFHPAIALLTMLLLALNPWHIVAGRIGEPWLAAALLTWLALWALLQAAAVDEDRWWVTSGLLLGLIGVAAPSLRIGVWLWGLSVAGLAYLNRRGLAERSPFLLTLLFLLGGILIGSLPGLAVAWNGGDAVAPLLDRLAVLLAAVVEYAGAQLARSPAAFPLATLALVGLGSLVRYGHRPRPGTIAAAAIAFFLALTLRTGEMLTPAGLLSFLLAPLILAAGAALEQLGHAFVRSWSILIRPAHALAAAFLFLLLAGGLAIRNLPEQIDSTASAIGWGVEPAMIRYIAAAAMEESTQGPETEPLATHFYVPPSLLDDPALRLQAAPQLEDGRIRPLGTLPQLLAEPIEGEARFLVPAEQRSLLELLGIFFPGGRVEPQFDADGVELTFNVYRVEPDNMTQVRGLSAAYFAGDEGEEASSPIFRRVDAPLVFNWAQSPPLEAPFRVEWQGLLQVPEAGMYGFFLDGVPENGDPATTVSLQLDDVITLDTSLGLYEQHQLLAEGIYRIDVTFSARETLYDFAINWEPPNLPAAMIPQELLLPITPPNVGLLGTYYSDDSFEGPALLLRKDLDIGRPAQMAFPYSVIWTGKLAAPRAGEYLLASITSGYLEMSVEGRPLINSELADRPTAGEEADAVPGYYESVIYLERGWHDIELRFAPDEPQATLELFWQPPGSAPETVSPRYLLPKQGEIFVGDVALPPPPPLTDGRLASGEFSLTEAVDLRNVQTAVPPRRLPLLQVETLWTIENGCGARPHQLARPHGLAADPDAGRVYVADTDNRRVVAYTLDGVTDRIFTHEAFAEPVDLALTPTGLLLVLDAEKQQILILDTDTGEVASLPVATSFYRPRGIAVDDQGVIAVADTGGARVVLLSPEGDVLTSYAGRDTPLGRGQPVDAAMVANRVWTVTSEDGRLWDSELGGGVLVNERALSEDGPQIAPLADGSFFVSNPRRSAFAYHGSSGQPLRRYAFEGVLVTPTGLATLVDGDHVLIAVSDTDRCALSLWRTPRHSLALVDEDR